MIGRLCYAHGVPHELVHPNWHVVLIHYPLALLSAGLAIELVTLVFRVGTLRNAGRWMLLIGALSCLPAATSGLYAFYDVVRTAALGEAGKEPGGEAWYQLARYADGNFREGQWAALKAHLWRNACGTGLLVVTAVVFTGASDRARRRLYVPCLLVMSGAVGLLGWGSWRIGESIYTMGTGVEWGASAVEAGAAARFVPALQLHVVLAGLTMSAAVVALGRSIRAITATAAAGADGAGRPASETHDAAYADSPVVQKRMFVIGERVRPARWWMGAGVLGLCTAAAGVWVGSWADPEGRAAHWWDELVAAMTLPRNVAHVIVGVGLVVVTLVLAVVTRWFKRRTGLLGVFSGILVLLVAAQVWLGVLLMFDGSDKVSSLFEFRRPVVQDVKMGG
jgi:uncharacterized membrane protein